MDMAKKSFEEVYKTILEIQMVGRSVGFWTLQNAATQCKRIELPAKLLDYFLRNFTSNINQNVSLCG